MKTLMLLRHAKSSWENTELADFDRPLNARGLKAAPKIGKLISAKKLKIDVILSSPAERAAKTAVLVSEAARLEAEIKYVEKIYEASPLMILHLLAEQDDSYENILLVGHNPGLERLTELLTGETIAMKTATLAKISLDIESWQEISPGSGKLDYVLYPEGENSAID